MSDVVEVIVTGPAEFMPGLVETLVGERLIACGQLMPIDSTYRWQGAIEHAAESRAALHTSKGNVAAVTKRVREVHPYEVPCVLVVPILSGDGDYLEWVSRQTHDESQPRDAKPNA